MINTYFEFVNDCNTVNMIKAWVNEIKNAWYTYYKLVWLLHKTVIMTRNMYAVHYNFNLKATLTDTVFL